MTEIPIVDSVFDGKDDYIEIPDDLQFSVGHDRAVKRGRMDQAMTSQIAPSVNTN